MSTIKKHLLPDSSLSLGILICLVIVGIKYYAEKSHANNIPGNDPKAAQIISTLTDNYLNQLGDGETAKPIQVGPAATKNRDSVNVKPTDPNSMIERSKAEEAAASSLLEMLDRMVRPAELTVVPQTHLVDDLGFPTSVMFHDALPENSPTASSVTQDVSFAKNWLFRNLGKSLEWFERQMLQMELIDQIFEVLDQAKADGKNLRLCFGSGVVGQDAAILAVRNNDNFLFNVPKEHQERYGCEKHALAHSQKGQWIPPGERTTTIDNMTCKVQRIENGDTLVELAADCCFDVMPIDSSCDVLAEIWIGDRCIQNIARFELKPDHLKKDKKFRFSTDMQLSKDIDPSRPFLVFLSLVKSNDESKDVAELVWSPELAAKYSSISNVASICYDGGMSNNQ